MLKISPYLQTVLNTFAIFGTHLQKKYKKQFIWFFKTFMNEYNFIFNGQVPQYQFNTELSNTLGLLLASLITKIAQQKQQKEDILDKLN